MKWLKHRLPIVSHFDWALAITLSAPVSELEPLAAPGLALDSQGANGFLAIACVQARRLRPAFWPAWLGVDFFLVGYRLFVTFSSPSGRMYRGLQILGSETDGRLMSFAGRWLTHYGYRRAETNVTRDEEKLRVSTSTGLELGVSLVSPELPRKSVFEDWNEARRYAGPMPYTFASEDGGLSIVRVEGVRRHWKPKPVTIASVRAPFFDRLLSRSPIPASAFLVEDVDYRWKPGIRESLTT